jgi:hypothetical protein
MVKFVCEYADGKLLSVYTDNITEGITMGFNKENCTMAWHFYQQNCWRSYHQNNFVWVWHPCITATPKEIKPGMAATWVCMFARIATVKFTWICNLHKYVV